MAIKPNHKGECEMSSWEFIDKKQASSINGTETRLWGLVMSSAREMISVAEGIAMASKELQRVLDRTLDNLADGIITSTFATSLAKTIEENEGKIRLISNRIGETLWAIGADDETTSALWAILRDEIREVK